MTNADVFSGLQPTGLWEHFRNIIGIARPSGSEEKIGEHIRNWAVTHGFEVNRDAVGNVCVWVPASPGRERGQPVLLQAHMDMVCERNANSPFNAEEGNIHVVRDGEWIAADDTTLGADNGIGVAAALYAADSDVPHGRLGLIFTIDEERGLTGARNLDPTSFRDARILFNLDSEDDGVLFVGCAGGCNTSTVWARRRMPIPAGWEPVEVLVSGLRGGHSGMEINKNRLNAIRALTRALQIARKRVPFALASIEGGNKSNAIPRESRATLFMASDDVPKFREEVETARATLATQYRGLEDGIAITTKTPAAKPTTAFGQNETQQLLDLLYALPTGVVAMSQDIDGLVETSTNLGVISTKADAVEIICSSRSSVAPALRDLLDTLAGIGRLAGATVAERGGYPGWQPNLSSQALAVARRAYARLFAKEPEVTAVHAGLECGLIGEKLSGMDMVSFGPQMQGVHAPGERVHIPSVERFWKLLAAVLDELSS